MPKLIATKALTYATRRLLPGDEFVARNRDARVLVAIRKAKPGEGVVIDDPKKKSAKRRHPLDHDANGKKGGSKVADGDKEALATLRATYKEVVGKNAFNGWDATELQKRIGDHKAGASS
jgi:hypothetical protein